MSSHGEDDDQHSSGRRALDFVFANNVNNDFANNDVSVNNVNNDLNEGRASNTGFFSLPGLGGFDFDENEDKYFPFRNHNEDSRDPRQVTELNCRIKT